MPRAGYKLSTSAWVTEVSHDEDVIAAVQSSIGIMTTGGEELALDLMLATPKTFKYLGVPIPAATAALSPVLVHFGKMRMTYEERYFEVCEGAHRGLISREVSSPRTNRLRTPARTPEHHHRTTTAQNANGAR